MQFKLSKTAYDKGVTNIINVGTSLIESKNCIAIAQASPSVFATIGIHPNDLTDNWKDDIQDLKGLLQNKEKK